MEQVLQSNIQVRGHLVKKLLSTHTHPTDYFIWTTKVVINIGIGTPTIHYDDADDDDDDGQLR